VCWPVAFPSPPRRAQPTLTPLPTDVPGSPTLTPTSSLPPAYGEPAGCLSASEQFGRTSAQMLAYTDRLLGLSTPLAKRQLARAWNASARDYLPTGQDALAFATGAVQNRYTLQTMLNALHVAGFAAWLRQDEPNGEHILAVRIAPGVLDGPWGGYVRAAFLGAQADDTVIPTMRLTPCRWMVALGLAPDLPTGRLENANWDQPDFAVAAQAYLAKDSPAAFAVAHRIAWLDGVSESPALMCGPLAWAISADAGAFPPGYGGWYGNPKSFWLPKPSENGRPWSLFPPEAYILRTSSQPLGSADWSAYPLAVGDLVYTYSGGFGFDHVLVVSESDTDGNRFAVTNLVKHKPVESFSIQRILLYSPVDPDAGYFRDQWVNDRENGRTGDKGFEVFRWAWREKDLSGQPARYIVQPGDSLPLVAARWKTPPTLIIQANRIDPSAPLQVGQELVIPPNP
jgi:hypothetical protein